MKTWKFRILLGVTALVALALIAGGLSFTSAFAQGPGQGGFPPNAGHDNQAVLDLLKSTESELLQLRREGKSWLDIAASNKVSEADLLDALLKPMNERHAWMSQAYPQFNTTQMAEWMRTQFTNDLKVTEFGTMTDRHVFGGGGMMHGWNNNGFGGMMGNWNNNGFGGMLRGEGMMGNWNNGANRFGGMMRGGGMMHGWNNLPNVTPESAE